MEASHKTHRPHIKVGKEEEEEEDIKLIISILTIITPSSPDSCIVSGWAKAWISISASTGHFFARCYPFQKCPGHATTSWMLLITSLGMESKAAFTAELMQIKLICNNLIQLSVNGAHLCPEFRLTSPN